MILRKEDSGMALVGAILLMLVLAALAQAMFYVARNETHSGVRSRLRESAFYVADAGIEYAIHQAAPVGLSTTVPVGIYTGSLAGEAVVNVNHLPESREIISKGNVSSEGAIKAERTIRAEVVVGAQIPQFATMSGGTSNFGTDIEVYGVIYSREPIVISKDVVFRADINGNIGVYGAYGGGDSIDINGDIGFVDPDDSGGIFARETISGKGYLTGINHQEYYSVPSYSDDEILFADTDALINDATTGEDFGGDGTIDADGRIKFDKDTVIDLDDYAGDVYYYPGGIDFSKDAVIKGSGTFVVGGNNTGNGSDPAIDIAKHFGGFAAEANVNLIVADGGNWSPYDINVDKAVELKGIIQAPGDVNLKKNFELEGLLACGGDLDVGMDAEFTYNEDVVNDIPLKGGGEGVTILSWTEQ
ncbi:MAG: hypothetical protein ACQESB_03220 [Elusimicrobiota bacterium]